MPAANPLVFIDTNILLYAHDSAAGRKRDEAAILLAGLWREQRGALSVQVLQEFFVNVTRKIPKPLTLAQARDVMRGYGPWVRGATTTAHVLRASEIMELAKLSFWDGLIIASAEAAGAELLASEDLQHGQTIAGVTVMNPFAAAQTKRGK